MIREAIVKLTVRIHDVVELVKRFESSPSQAMAELREEVRRSTREVLERVMEAELELFLGRDAEVRNTRNGFAVRRFAFKGLGALEVRVPRDRAGRFESRIVPKSRRYDVALEQDLALLHMAGLSTRTLSHLSARMLGIAVSAQEVSNALSTIVPAAKAFLERNLSGRTFKYLYVDGTNFTVRRSTVEREPTLVVIGVDAQDRKSVLAMIQGDKDSRSAWAMVFARLKERGLDGAAVQLGVMDGLPGLSEAFLEAFPNARIARCWVHKLRNVMPRVAKRYQAAFKADWDTMAYADGRASAEAAFVAFKARWQPLAAEAVGCFEKDLEALFCHTDFPREHWNALRTTNPIERVNKECKRRTKSMEQVSSEGLHALLAFTALRLEWGWSMMPISAARLSNLERSPTRQRSTNTPLDAAVRGLLN